MTTPVIEKLDVGLFSLSLLPGFSKRHVHIRNVTEVAEKVKSIIAGGSDLLQIITDFDRTLTKHDVDGVPIKTSYGIFENCTNLPDNFKEKCKNLSDKYHPVEISPNMTVEEKIPYMVEWWKQSEELYCGITLEENEIDNAVERSDIQFRDGCSTMFKKLNEKSVPVLVFSAGLGDIITSVLKSKSLNYPNVHVISNFFKFNGAQITGYSGNTIHIFNKNEHAVENSDYFQEVCQRTNVLLMGDSLGDANMAEGVADKATVLKVGFLTTDNVDKHLPQYMDAFDIVLVEDQTMEIPMEILNFL